MKLSAYQEDMAAQALRMQATMQAAYNGKYVRMNVGKYKGRIAKIDAVMLHTGYKPGWRFLCMVLNTRTGMPLNSDTASRSYHLAEDFELLDLLNGEYLVG